MTNESRDESRPDIDPEHEHLFTGSKVAHWSSGEKAVTVRPGYPEKGEGGIDTLVTVHGPGDQELVMQVAGEIVFATREGEELFRIGKGTSYPYVGAGDGELIYENLKHAKVEFDRDRRDLDAMTRPDGSDFP